jgi:hypothetical protein
MFLLLRSQYGFNIFAIFYKMLLFLWEFTRYSQLERNNRFTISSIDLYPCLTDRTSTTPLDPVYFYQDTWASAKIFQNHPSHHYDVGSSVKTIGIISQLIPVTMIDIRPIELTLHGLSFKEGSIVQLPFDDSSIESISSLCVVEHIGLGRYGDPLDQFGSEKAMKELIRVTKSTGYIYFTVPIESKNRVYFNGYRSFTRQYIIDAFKFCELLEERYIYGKTISESHDPKSDNGIGLFMFRKR